jgi:hypothetical protein
MLTVIFLRFIANILANTDHHRKHPVCSWEAINQHSAEQSDASICLHFMRLTAHESVAAIRRL